MRRFLRRLFPQKWLHDEVRPYQIHLVLFTIAAVVSAILLLTGIGFGSVLAVFLIGGSVLFLQFFCPAVLQSANSTCGNVLDGLPDWGWVIVHLFSNAVVYYIILVLLFLVARSLRPIHGLE
ncbi:MAG: hypothetical protein JWM56_1220 [Candidatus Peribacteria bacterium]|nr:hypothetical protein [Candidatus Peribacteria bacterium]